MAHSVVSWRDEEARLRGLFRYVNEQIAELGEPFAVEGRRSFLCECGNPECTQAIELTEAEYEDLRARGRRFAVALNHENPEVEIVLSENGRFAVTETLVGGSSRIAEETDPRAQGDGHFAALEAAGRAGDSPQAVA